MTGRLHPCLAELVRKGRASAGPARKGRASAGPAHEGRTPARPAGGRRTPLEPARGRETAVVPGEAWVEVLDQAAEEGLLPLLDGLTGLSPAQERQLRDRCLVETGRNLALAGELCSVLRALEEAAVPCVPLRGIALMERLYGGVVPRRTGDIDLLVRRRDLQALRGALTGLGYRERDRRPGFSDRFSYTLKFVAERSFVVVLEPHFSLAYPPFVEGFDMEGVWRRCVPGRVMDRPVRRLDPADLLLHLGLHLVHRDDPPAAWLLEMARLVRAEGEAIEWERLVDQARRAGVGRLLGRALRAVEDACGTPVSEEVTRGLAAPPDGRVSWARRLAERPGLQEREGIAQLLAIPGVLGKMRYVGSLLFPTPRFMMEQYGLPGRSRLPLAYARRMARFLWEGLRGLARLGLSRATG